MVSRRRTGHALLVAIIVMLIVGAASALIWTHYRLQARLVLRQARQVRLVALNDAAVAEALAQLAENPGYRGEGPHPFAVGEISNEIRSLPDDRREVIATAKYRGWTRRTRLVVTIVSGGPRVDTWSVYRGNK